jgi:hypothetical protein
VCVCRMRDNTEHSCAFDYDEAKVVTNAIDHAS